MHYCQRCAGPQLLEPDDGGRARCPACDGWYDGPARAPLIVITGASGSGKTTIFVPLARALAEDCLTFDADLLLDAAGALSGGRPIDWSAFHAALLAVAHGAGQSSRATVLLAPLVPGVLEPLPARRWVGDISYVVLDCPDDVRRERLVARPPWRDRDIEKQVSFGCWLRANIPDTIDTSRGSPVDVAAAAAAWVRGRLAARA